MEKTKTNKNVTKTDRVWKNRGYRLIDMELGDHMDVLIYMYERDKEEDVKRP